MSEMCALLHRGKILPLQGPSLVPDLAATLWWVGSISSTIKLADKSKNIFHVARPAEARLCNPRCQAYMHQTRYDDTMQQMSERILAIKSLSATAPVRCWLASLSLSAVHKAPVCVACPLRMRFIMQRKSVTNNGNVIPRVEPQWVVGMSSG